MHHPSRLTDRSFLCCREPCRCPVCRGLTCRSRRLSCLPRLRQLRSKGRAHRATKKELGTRIDGCDWQRGNGASVADVVGCIEVGGYKANRPNKKTNLLFLYLCPTPPSSVQVSRFRLHTAQSMTQILNLEEMFY